VQGIREQVPIDDQILQHLQYAHNHAADTPMHLMHHHHHHAQDGMMAGEEGMGHTEHHDHAQGHGALDGQVDCSLTVENPELRGVVYKVE